MERKYLVLEKHFVERDTNIVYNSKRLHPHLIGKVGVEIDYQDDAYDTEYPTGYERAYIQLRFEDGKEAWVDTAFCLRVKENN